MKTKKIILGSLIILSSFTNCSKVADAVLEEATPLTSSDFVTEAKIDNTIDDVSNLVQDQYAVQAAATKKTSAVIPSILPTCATPSVILANGTYTRTIDFGTTGCVLNNGNTVKGKIIMSFSSDFNYIATPKIITYTLENFYHNNNLVTGNKTITISAKTTTAPEYHTVVTHDINTTITFNTDKKIYIRKGTLIREFIEGEFTTDILSDNVFSVTGTTNTTLPNGATITNTITKPLIVKGSCNKTYPLEGSVTTTKNSYEAVIDFGDGTCDDQATFTTKGITLVFTIQRP